MNEASWLAADDPIPMLDFLNAGLARPGVSLASPRKLRLFACACCRQAWHLLSDSRSRRAVEVAERFADGGASAGELRAARVKANEPPCDTLAPHSCPRCLAVAAAAVRVEDFRSIITPFASASLVRDVFGNPFRPVGLRHLGNALCRRCDGAGTRPDVYPPAPCPACSCVTPVALSVARRAYDERDFAALPVLADALEDAGCEDGPLLWHLRGEYESAPEGWYPTGPHVRGCHALDLVLGKS